MVQKIKLLCLGWLTIPHLLIYLVFLDKEIINQDIDRWLICANTFLKDNVKGCNYSKVTILRFIGLVLLLVSFPEFRNIFYLRCGYFRFLLCYLRPNPSLYIYTKSSDFGPGVFIQHGFSTIILAEHIGKNCWINQQVTIGYNDSKKYGYGKPWIGDNVRISCGAKVCGKIRVGNGSVIGLNSVVVKDVLPSTTVLPAPMRFLSE